MLVEMKDICKDYPQGKETVRILKLSRHHGPVRLRQDDAHESHRLP